MIVHCHVSLLDRYLLILLQLPNRFDLKNPVPVIAKLIGCAAKERQVNAVHYGTRHVPKVLILKISSHSYCTYIYYCRYIYYIAIYSHYTHTLY